MMIYDLLNPKMIEFVVKILFDYLPKGLLFFCYLNFLKKFKFRSNPDYYNSIKDPIDLIKIQQKIHSDEYSSFEQFLDDIKLLLNNTKDFYRVLKISFCFF